MEINMALLLLLLCAIWRRNEIDRWLIWLLCNGRQHY